MQNKRLIFVSEATPNTKIIIEGEEHLHLSKVLRAKEGHEFGVSTGKGDILRAILLESKPRKSIIQCFEALENKIHPPQITLAVALLKGKDLEEVIETCAQLNIAKLIPLISERTQGADKREWQKLKERLIAKSIVCTKQALKPWLTQIDEPIELKSFLKSRSEPLFLMEPTLQTQEFNWGDLKDCTLLCGPEGGWSDEEIAEMKKLNNLYSFNLGSTIIRAKNAPFYALGKLSALAPQLF